MKKHKEATAQEQSCAVASFLFFRVERTDQNEDSADHIDCRDRSRARRPLGSSGSALVEREGYELSAGETAYIRRNGQKFYYEYAEPRPEYDMTMQ